MLSVGGAATLVEPPSPQEFAPLHNQAVGRVPRPLKINASHDMYLRFGPQFPDGQTSSLMPRISENRF